MTRNRSIFIAAGFGLGILFLALPHPGRRTPASQTAPAPESHAPLAQSSASASPRYCENLYRAICQKRGETRDPTGVVRSDADGEIQALRLYEEIIHAHPGWTSEQVDEELVNTIYTPKRRKRLEAAYRLVQSTLVEFIERQPDTVLDRREKKLLKSRVKKTQLQLPPPASNYADEPDLFTKNDVFYERNPDGQMRMRVGGAYLLAVKSWFNLIFTLGHELGHSIDPCELRAMDVSLPAYDRLTGCFLSNGLVAIRKTRAECGENDQLSETFADWIGVHVTAEVLKNFSTEFHGPQVYNAAANSVRDLCEQDDSDDLDYDYHPSPQIRIERIFGHNPMIRDVLGCGPITSGPSYCTFEWQVPDEPGALVPPSAPKETKDASTHL